jgi:hypothetical protein
MSPDDKVAKAAKELLDSLKMASMADVSYAWHAMKDRANNLSRAPEERRIAKQLTSFLRKQYQEY